MTTTLRLAEFPGREGLSLSPFANKVRFALAAKDLPFVSDVWLSAKKSPTRKLPLLFDGTQCIADSSEIVRYLDQKFPSKPLIPTDARDAADVALWEEWADESLTPLLQFARVSEPAGVQLFVDIVRQALPRTPGWLVAAVTARRQRNSRRVKFAHLADLGPAVVRRQIDRALDTLEAHAPEHGWLLGGELTLADVSVAASLTALQGYPSPVQAALAARRRSSAWFERVLAAVMPRLRPAAALLVPAGGGARAALSA